MAVEVAAAAEGKVIQGLSRNIVYNKKYLFCNFGFNYGLIFYFYIQLL